MWKLLEGRQFKREGSGFSYTPLKQPEEALDDIHFKGEVFNGS